MIDNFKEKNNYPDFEDLMKRAGFGGILKICHWTKVDIEFVKWVVENFEKTDQGSKIRLTKTKVLNLTEEDVHRVYNLPRGQRKIDLRKCTKEGADRLKRELGVTGDDTFFVEIKEFDKALEKLKNGETMCKAAILYTIYSVLCPTNTNKVSLHYASILEDMSTITTYNWCDHVLKHVEQGISDKKQMHPTADFHFLMIMYLERAGKDCRYMTGQYQVPSLQGWDVSAAYKFILSMEKSMGLGNAVLAGFSKERKPIADPQKQLFAPENCPIEKVPKHIEFCKTQIENSKTKMDFYRDCLQTLEKRMGKKKDIEANSDRRMVLLLTNEENDDVQQQKKNKESVATGSTGQEPEKKNAATSSSAQQPRKKKVKIVVARSSGQEPAMRNVVATDSTAQEEARKGKADENPKAGETRREKELECYRRKKTKNVESEPMKEKAEKEKNTKAEPTKLVSKNKPMKVKDAKEKSAKEPTRKSPRQRQTESSSEKKGDLQTTEM